MKNTLFPKLDVPPIVLLFWLALLGIVLLLGFFMPIFNDEIDWSYSNQRAIQDKFHLITLLPQCQTPDSYAKILPLTWYPFAWINHLLYMQTDSLLLLRVLAMARFLLLLASMGFILAALTPYHGLTLRYSLVLVLSLMLLDSTPLLSQVNRPEQTLITTVALFLAFALNAHFFAQNNYKKYFILGVCVIAILCFFPSHSKAICLLPIILFCCYQLLSVFGFKKWLTCCILSIIVFFAVQSALLWLTRFACPYSPGTQEIINENTIPFNLLTSDPISFFKHVIQILQLAIIKDFLMPSYLWLPYSLTSFSIPTYLSVVVLFIVGVLNISMVIYCAKFTIKTVFNEFKNRSHYSYELQQQAQFLKWLACIMTISLVACILIVGKYRLFYIKILEIPLIYLTTILCLCAQGKLYVVTKKMRVILAVICALAFTNICLLTLRYYPYITSQESRTRVIPWDGFKRTVLYSPFDYKEQKRAIVAAYEACSLPEKSTAKHLVLDSYTYPVLKTTFEPFHFLYFIGGLEKYTIDIQTFIKRMNQYDSDGVMARCDQLPDNYLPYFTRYNMYCCYNPKAPSPHKE